MTGSMRRWFRRAIPSACHAPNSASSRRAHSRRRSRSGAERASWRRSSPIGRVDVAVIQPERRGQRDEHDGQVLQQGLSEPELASRHHEQQKERERDSRRRAGRRCARSQDEQQESAEQRPAQLAAIRGDQRGEEDQAHQRHRPDEQRVEQNREEVTASGIACHDGAKSGRAQRRRHVGGPECLARSPASQPKPDPSEARASAPQRTARDR